MEGLCRCQKCLISCPGIITWVICFVIVYEAVNLYCRKLSVPVLHITTKRLICISQDASDRMYMVNHRAPMKKTKKTHIVIMEEIKMLD